MPKATPITRYLLYANIGAYVFINIFLGFIGIDLNVLFSFLGLVPHNFTQGALWQPLTSMFLHGGFIHLAMNMIALWSIGSLIENKLGAGRFTWLYFLSGLGGALLVLVLPGNPVGVTVGASGAILGLLGALAYLYPNSPLVFFIFPMKARTAALVFGGVSLVAAVFFSGAGGISHAGHLGGLLVGFLFTRYLSHKVEPVTYNEYDRGGYDFSRSTARDARYYEPSSTQQTEGPKKLYYDSATGRFFFE